MKQNTKYFGRSKMLDALHGTASFVHLDAYTMPLLDSPIDPLYTLSDKPLYKPRRVNLMISGRMAYPLFHALTRMDNRPKVTTNV